MLGIEKVTSIIGGIYDASLDPSGWTDVLARINLFVDGQASGIFSKDEITKSGTTHYYSGADPYYIQLYSDSHAQFDPLQILPPKGRITAIPDLVSYDNYRRGPFYQDWLRPQGCADALNVVLNSSGIASATLLTVLPGRARMVDPEMRRRVEFLVPHLSRALLIGNALEVKQGQSTALADTLNGFKAAIFIMDAAGRVVHCNSAGQSLLGEGNVLRLSGGRLIALDGKSDKLFRRLIMEAPEQQIVLESNSETPEHYIVQRLPLSAVTRGKGSPGNAAVAILVRKAAMDSSSPANLVARTFSLTPTELRVMLAIIDVGGVPEAAGALGIAETTVKTHLHRIFSKTGTKRQADLVKLAAGFSGPLSG